MNKTNLYLPLRTDSSYELFNNLTQNKPLLGTVSLLRDEDGTQPSQGCFNFMRTEQPTEVEVWKDVFEYENFYRVSSYGKIFSVRKNRMMVPEIIHLVAFAFIEAVDGKNEINHIDGDKNNNFISNLQWSTRSENILHAFRTGLRERKMVRDNAGENNPRSKLKTSDVIRIRELNKTNSINEIALMYSIGRGYTKQIIERKFWKNV